MKIFELNLFWIHIAPTYYGLMYALGFIIGYSIIQHRILSSRSWEKSWWLHSTATENLFFYIFAGVILWGRVWYILFYDFWFYLNHPFDIIKLWNGGMSFHGGVLGVIISLVLFSKKYHVNFFRVTDELCAVLPIGIAFGRIGNYLNKELLWFSPYNGWLAVYKNWVWYFPSPLLESFLEWVILFIILYYAYKKRTFYWQVWALFLIFYGIFRMFIEYFIRIPDPLFSFVNISMGFVLSVPMFVIGICLYFFLSQKKI